jgi:hypothetical protein
MGSEVKRRWQAFLKCANGLVLLLISKYEMPTSQANTSADNDTDAVKPIRIYISA